MLTNSKEPLAFVHCRSACDGLQRGTHFEGPAQNVEMAEDETSLRLAAGSLDAKLMPSWHSLRHPIKAMPSMPEPASVQLHLQKAFMGSTKPRPWVTEERLTASSKPQLRHRSPRALLFAAAG